MAGEEGDSELRDLVAQTLETQGVLGKIRVCCSISIETILICCFRSGTAKSKRFSRLGERQERR